MDHFRIQVQNGSRKIFRFVSIFSPNLSTISICMKSTSLDDRIRSVRKGVRSRQPLDYRIDLVRKLHNASKGNSQKARQVRLPQGG